MNINNNTDEKILNIGADTGHIYGEIPKKKKYSRKPHIYVLMFCNEIAKERINIPFALTKIVLMIDEENRVDLGIKNLTMLSVALKISVGRLRNYITSFVNDNIFLRLSPANYFVNPRFFSKANTNQIKALINEYNAKKAEIEEVAKKKLIQENKELKKEIELEKTGNILVREAHNILYNSNKAI